VSVDRAAGALHDRSGAPIANKIDAEAPAGIAADGGCHADATDAPQVASAKERSDS
jgi:hypothetical protein